jgi:autophagy-related protein 27
MKPSALPFVATSLLLPSLSIALTFDCSNIQVKGKKFNFEKIGGPHTVSVVEHFPPSIHNTTWTVDLCDTLKKDKNIPAGDQCLGGSQGRHSGGCTGVTYRLTWTTVCGILTTYNPNDDEKPRVDEVYPIAGKYHTSTGKGLEPKYERLEKIPDSDMRGLRLELHGGTYKKQSQMAIIDLQCDPERTGNERSPPRKGEDDEDEKLRNAESDEKDDPDEDDDEENSLRFVSYKKEDDNEVLRLDWRTKYACQEYDDNDDKGSGKDSSGKHWGFFTWFIVL